MSVKNIKNCYEVKIEFCEHYLKRLFGNQLKKCHHAGCKTVFDVNGDLIGCREISQKNIESPDFAGATDNNESDAIALSRKIRAMCEEDVGDKTIVDSVYKLVDAVIAQQAHIS